MFAKGERYRTEDMYMELKDKIARMRKVKGLTQLELAKKVGITKRAIQNYESGNRTPRLDVITKIAQALEVDTHELMSDEEHFVIQAADQYGSRGKVSAEKLIENATALFAGGDISEADKANVMEALQEAYWRSKIKNKKYTPKKYRKDELDNTEKNNDE